MIALTVPWALAGLALLVGPLLVHMLLRRKARRIVFPTTRFLVPTRAAAVRFRRPSDPALLFLRLAIVTAAVIAAAQPLLVTRWRIARWNARMARAVVLDTSRSMPNPSAASRLAEQELHAFAASTFAGDDLADALTRASEWLARMPPARREVVVVSDFQRGALDAAGLAVIPPSAGLRFIRAGAQPATREASLPVVSGWRHGDWQPSLTLRGNTLDAAWTRVGRTSAESVAWLSTRQPRADADPAARAVAAALSFGVASGDSRERVVVEFDGTPRDASRTIETPWMFRATLALRQSALLRESGAEVDTSERAGALVVRTNVAASSAAAAAVVRAVMLALGPPAYADPELETATLSDAQLARWRREAAPVQTPAPGTLSDGVESRWLWGLALLLIGTETWVRRAAPRDVELEAHADAA